MQKYHKFSDFDNEDVFIVIEQCDNRKIVYRNPYYYQIVNNESKPSYDKRFLTVTTFLSEIEGELSAVEVALPILPVTDTAYNVDLRTRVSKVASYIRSENHNDFTNLEGIKTQHEGIIDKIIFEAMEFYNSPYAQIFAFSDDDYYGVSKLYKYELKGHKSYPSEAIVLNDYWENSLGNFFEKGYSLLCESIEGFKPFDVSLYQKFLDRGISDIVMIPFFMESKLSGLVMLSNTKSSSDDTTDLFLADYVSNSIGLMMYRGFLFEKIYYDKLTEL